jgi:hypothetical protein
MTNFVTNLADQPLKHFFTSKIAYGPPCGLLAHILTAVCSLTTHPWTKAHAHAQLERAARAYETGELIKPYPFSGNYEAMADEYLVTTLTFKKWDQFYKKCNISKTCRSPMKRRRSSIAVDIGRGNFNYSSSPAKV